LTNLVPERSEFLRQWRREKSQLLRMLASGDLDTPVSLTQKLARPGAPCFLLESVTGGESRGRYSIFGTDPDLLWRCRDGRAETASEGNAWRPDELDPVASLRRLIAASRMELPEGSPPPAAGLFGYLGYDMARLVERLRERQVAVSFRGDAIRVAPHLYNDADDAAALLDAVG